MILLFKKHRPSDIVCPFESSFEALDSWSQPVKPL